MAGFPCQSFSIAGDKKGFEDTTRGTLFFHVADIIKETKPKAFLLENVEGLFRHDKGKTFKIIIDTLAKELNYKIVGVEELDNGELKYSAESFLRKTIDFGLPQKRVRTYIVGFSNDIIPKNYKLKPLPINNQGIRVMTPIEWARLQGFKDYAFLKNEVDTFSFPKGVSETQQYKQLGNSVSIPVIEEIAYYIYQTLEKV